MSSQVNESQSSDIDAMHRLRAGDDLALNDLMQRWKAPLIAYLFRQLGNEAEAIDLAQETFVKVYEQRSRYHSQGKFATWLFTIATNLCRNHLRWRKRHPSLRGESSEEERESLPTQETVDAGLNPDQSLLTKERAAMVSQAVASLPPDLKTALLLYEYEQHSYEEIARIDSCTVKAVESRLARARKKLKALLLGSLLK